MLLHDSKLREPQCAKKIRVCELPPIRSHQLHRVITFAKCRRDLLPSSSHSQSWINSNIESFACHCHLDTDCRGWIGSRSDRSQLVYDHHLQFKGTRRAQEKPISQLRTILIKDNDRIRILTKRFANAQFCLAHRVNVREADIDKVAINNPCGQLMVSSVEKDTGSVATFCDWGEVAYYHHMQLACDSAQKPHISQLSTISVKEQDGLRTLTKHFGNVELHLTHGVNGCNVDIDKVPIDNPCSQCPAWLGRCCRRRRRRQRWQLCWRMLACCYAFKVDIDCITSA
mmetsp:Transcript_24516/g.47638  ORF Transcript_24516/g.47638 Transcript_24516/m.47638 type:complete len:285 (+) Transcript_24516:606-1460(+)